jgi:hypothetical protein
MNDDVIFSKELHGILEKSHDRVRVSLIEPMN